MKTIKKVIAAVLAAASLLSFASCTKRTAGDQLQTQATAADGSVIAEPTKPLAEKTFQDVYGYQLESFLNRQYYFEGEPIPIAETNYYFIDSFLTLNQYSAYGIYPTLPDGFVDLSAAITSDPNSEDAGKTYGDFLIEYSERVIESTCIVAKKARDEGLTLPQESRDEIDYMISQFNEQFAIPEGITLDQLFNLYYYDTCNEAEFRAIMENYYLAELYTSQYVDSYEFSDAELYHPNIRYALYYAPEMTSTPDTLASQEELANALLAECEGSLDTFQVLGDTRAATGEVEEFGDIVVAQGQTVPAFDAWAFDESRQEGDMEVIQSTEYGFFVVGYLGRAEIDYSEKQQIAVAALGDAVTASIDNGEYQFYTNDALKHVPTADEIEKIKSRSETTTIVLIILLIVGVIMLIVAIILLIRSRKKTDPKGGNKKGASTGSSSKKKKAKPQPEPEEDDDDEDDEDDDEDPEDDEEDED